MHSYLPITLYVSNNGIMLQNVLERLSQVEKKVAAKGQQVDGPVGGVELRDYQLQVLARLRQIRGTSMHLLLLLLLLILLLALGDNAVAVN